MPGAALALVLALTGVILGFSAPARAGAPSPLDTTFDPGTGADYTVEALAVQPDGKVLLGGHFWNINGTARNRIARLNANGSLDTTFNPGTGASYIVNALAVQADGKVLLGGWFWEFNGTARNHIARLNANGSLDASFATDASDSVLALAVQPDGKILLGGGFGQINGTGRNDIARLNANGTLDTSFNPGTGTNNDVLALALQPDGKVLLGGKFTSINGTARNRIARLNANGSLDTSFNPGTGADWWVEALALQSDGKVLVGGDFYNINGTARDGIARLNADGSLDTTFDPGTGVNGSVFTLALRTGGKVLVGGDFYDINGTARNNVAGLNADGSVDTAFDPGAGTNNYILALAAQADGKALLGGQFTQFNGTARNYIARLNAPIIQYTLAYTPGTNGSISGTTRQTVNQGASGSQVTAVPNTGYHFVQWSDGVPTAARTDTNVTANKSVTASFAINQYTLTFQTDGTPGASLAGTTPQTINYGLSGSPVTAKAPAGHCFVKWTLGGADYSTRNPLTVINVRGNRALIAVFGLSASVAEWSVYN